MFSVYLGAPLNHRRHSSGPLCGYDLVRLDIPLRIACEHGQAIELFFVVDNTELCAVTAI